MDTPGWSLAHLDSVLAAMAGPAAVARADQATAVEALVEQRRRVLVVQATGWGKSAVYWGATSALRAQGAGPTIVISPLLALMRDQIAAASAAGLRAATVNSTNFDDWQQVFDALAADTLDLLLVSPERLANPRFERVALPLLARAGLLVIDEAHCISDWGFDFRPDYQRISGLLLRLAPQTPVLATTATANARVTDDVARQLGSETLVLRGPLARSSLRLSVVPGLDGVARAAWVSEALAGLPGSGIVYSLTVEAAHTLADFLRAQGHAVAAYTGRTPADERERIEAGLKANELKAVVATSALGMGYDKPDLGFCVHVGSPDSPIAYYQQVGRAGRALDTAVGVLLQAADVEAGIWEYFATAAIPDPRAADRLLAALAEADGPMTVPALESASGLRRGRLEALLKTLRVDGAVDRRDDGWVATGVPWRYDQEKYEGVVEARRREHALMRDYARGARCLMQILTEALDDPEAGRCGRCSVCTGELPDPGCGPAGPRSRRPVPTCAAGMWWSSRASCGRPGPPRAAAGSRAPPRGGRSASPRTRPGPSSSPSCPGPTPPPRRSCAKRSSRCSPGSRPHGPSARSPWSPCRGAAPCGRARWPSTSPRPAGCRSPAAWPPAPSRPRTASPRRGRGSRRSTPRSDWPSRPRPDPCSWWPTPRGPAGRSPWRPRGCGRRARPR